MLCAVAVALGRVQTAWRNAGQADLLSRTARSIVLPMAVPTGSLTHRGENFFSGIFSGGAHAAENRQLKDRLQALSFYSEQIDRLEQEVSSLRTLEGFGPVPGKTRVPANVIGYFPYENIIILDAGRDKGIASGCPVVAPTGLVGTVQTVEAARCQVLLVTNASLTIGAIDLTRKPPPAGLLRGENSSTLTLSFQDPKAPVEIGDMIVTSGFSQKIPRGIIIGKVIHVDDSEELGTRRARVDPAVALGTVREVHVLR